MGLYKAGRGPGKEAYRRESMFSLFSFPVLMKCKSVDCLLSTRAVFLSVIRMWAGREERGMGDGDDAESCRLGKCALFG